MLDNRPDKDLKILRDHCEELLVHFDSVQIFATKSQRDNGEKHPNTYALSDGLGNYYARFGQIQMWIHEQTQKAADDEIKNYE